MRATLRLALAAAAAAAVALPAAPASALLCREPLGPVCTTVCDVLTALDRGCPR